MAIASPHGRVPALPSNSIPIMTTCKALGGSAAQLGWLSAFAASRRILRIHLQPRPEVATFHYTGDVRALFTELGICLWRDRRV